MVGKAKADLRVVKEYVMEEKLLNIRRASLEDIDDIYSVEIASFPVAWSKEAFVGELTTNHFAQYYVLELEGKVVGYAGMWIIIDEAHITNIAILPEARGQKLGELLMTHMMAIAQPQGARGMTLEVRISNHVAIRLYEKLGFEQRGIRKNYYADTMEDALIMWVNL